jgi:hypothetical protein
MSICPTLQLGNLVRSVCLSTFTLAPNFCSQSLTALMFHAGGFVLGSTDMIPKKQITFLVQTGFVVVTPEYRLCPQASLYDGPIQDAKDVLAWCQKDLPPLMAEKDIQVNGTKVVTMGHSAGGMLALVTVHPTPPYPTAYRTDLKNREHAPPHPSPSSTSTAANPSPTLHGSNRSPPSPKCPTPPVL